MDVEQKMTGELDGRKRVCVSCWITKYLATLCSQGKCMVKPITLREYFLMNHHNQNTLMNVPERNRFVQAIQHEVGVASDMQTLSKFVREQIFYVFVHDFKMIRMTDCRRKGKFVKNSLRVISMWITRRVF